MQKTKQTSTRLLVIAITTAAIISAVTTTVSLSAATPAFARFIDRCDASGCTSVGGTSNKQQGVDVPGGGGGRIVSDENGLLVSSSAGGGQNAPPDDISGQPGIVGGGGQHTTCDGLDCTNRVGGSGLHVKGPGGNSDDPIS
jgi:hypothetical protein